MSASFEIFNDNEFELILRNEFLTDASDILEEIEPSILAFEKNPQDHRELLQAIRLIQSFKDSAATAGFAHLARFSQQILSLLEGLRSGEIAADERAFEALLRSSDGLREYHMALTKNHQSAFDTSPIEALVQKAFGKQEAKAKPEPVVSSQSTPKANDSKQTKTPDKLRILVVDDEPELREVVRLILIDEGYDVVEAENGRQALDMVLKDSSIKLLLTDQSMPIMKGEELVQKLREQHIKIPVIVITGVADHTAAVKFIRSGVYLYLTKPIDADDLLIAVRNALRAGELSETLTKALGLTFRNYLRLRRVDPQSTHPMTQMKLEFDMAEDLKTMGELITKVLRKD